MPGLASSSPCSRLTSLEQIAALKEGRIDAGFGRIPFDDALVERRVLRNYPNAPRPSYADQVLMRRSRLFGQLPGRNKLKAGSRRLV